MKHLILLSATVMIFCSTAYAQAPELSVAKYKADKDCATSFTFDDGLIEHKTIVAPELQKRGWRGTFWICGAKVDGEQKSAPAYMTWEQIASLAADGHEVSNHGWNHKKLSKLSPERIREEVDKNDSAIFVHTGRKPTTFCYPYNSKNEQVLEIAGKGRVGTRTRQYAFGQAVDHSKTVKRMDDAIRNREWAVWMTHGITTGYDSFNEPERFTAFLDYVQSVEDKVWVGTFHEVASYQKERENLQFTLRQKGKKWIVSLKLDLDSVLYDQKLTLILGDDKDRVQVKQGHRKLDVYYKNGKALVDFDPYGDDLSIKF